MKAKLHENIPIQLTNDLDILSAEWTKVILSTNAVDGEMPVFEYRQKEKIQISKTKYST